MDTTRYDAYLRSRHEIFENLCARCGECCGAFSDPCSNLGNKDGKYFCKIYDKRLGPQKTVSGASFTCVPIKNHIKNHTLRPECAYQNK